VQTSGQPRAGRVAIFAPNPLLTVVVEERPGGGDEVHVHAGGQGVWVARMAATLGAEPILCGFCGGETGALLAPLLAALPGERRLVATGAPSGCYVMDRRSGERELVAQALPGAPTRHELDDLVSATCAAALGCEVLVLCNPYPANAVPAAVYGALAADVGAQGVRVVADLSTPRLDAVLPARPELVKVNDWELAEFVRGPVGEPEQLAGAATRLLDGGARMVVVTRAERPAVVFDRSGAWEVVPPPFAHGFREGCGDSMTGAMAAVLACGGDWREALVQGAAAGAVNFLRRGLGTGSADVVAELAGAVTVREL
jgi:1-phosphofructokinase